MCFALIQCVILIYKYKKHVNDVFSFYFRLYHFHCGRCCRRQRRRLTSHNANAYPRNHTQRGTALVSKSIDFLFLVKMDSSRSSAVASDLVWMINIIPTKDTYDAAFACDTKREHIESCSLSHWWKWYIEQMNKRQSSAVAVIGAASSRDSSGKARSGQCACVRLTH